MINPAIVLLVMAKEGITYAQALKLITDSIKNTKLYENYNTCSINYCYSIDSHS